MIIRDAIERANNEQEIFLLLTSYVETVRQGDHVKLLPWQVRDLPLAGSDDLKARIYGLQLRAMPPDVDHSTRLVVEETVEIFRTALRRHAFLQANCGAP